MTISTSFRLKKRPLRAGRRIRLIFAEVEKVLKKHGLQHIRQRGLVTRTWKEEKPNFFATIDVKQARAEMTVKGSGDHGLNKWIWLDEGTKVR